MDKSHPNWIEIDLAQFRKNLDVIKLAIDGVRLCLPIKANAYGHGLVPIAKAAEHHVDYLAVAHSQEGKQLRQAGIATPILVLGAIHQEQVADLLHFDLEFSVSSPFKARMVQDACRALKKHCRVHLEVDTGMRRTGMRPETTAELYEKLLEDNFVDVVGIYSHLATGYSPTDEIALQQIDSFTSLVTSDLFAKRPLIKHLANSLATENLPSSYFDMVRPAMLGFGYKQTHSRRVFDAIAPCFSLKARAAYFKIVQAGEGIGYGHTYKAPRQSRIVTVPVGYGDGYRRSLSNLGAVLIHGKRYPIVGTVCMDQFMIDVGEDSVFVGDEIVLIGHQGELEISLQEIASLCKTIPYEVLCLFNDRIPRVYKD